MGARADSEFQKAMKSSRFPDAMKRLADRGEFLATEDGFLQWWPGGGDWFISPTHLRAIADLLDAANEAWRLDVIAAFDRINERDNLCAAKCADSERSEKQSG